MLPRLLPLPSATLRQWHSLACSPLWTSRLPILAKSNTLQHARITLRCNQTSTASPTQQDDPQVQSLIEFHRTASRHVLRAILRECTYFPDRFAAEWIRQHALSSYRTYETRIWKNRNDPAFIKRLEIVRRKSRQAMYQLQRANEGDRRMLVKAISMAYGRIGKRRRQLMAPLLPVEQREQYLKGSEGSEEGLDQPHTETPATGADAQKGTGLHQKPSKGRPSGTVKDQVKEAVDNLPRPLCALVQSQTAASPPTVARRNLRRLGTEIPELNSWHKPMPQVRIKNKLKQWYANVLSTVQPPLPDAEWRSLRDLALRQKEVKLPIRRRKQLATPPSMLEMVVMRGKLPAELFRKDHAHKITPRYMQRIWATVFSQCPLMEYDSQAEKWNFTWGNHVLNDRRTGDSVDIETATDQPPLTQKILPKDKFTIQNPQ